MFKPVGSRVGFPQMEQDILAFWQDHDVFRKSLQLRAGSPRFVFYEGPPTANGAPGIHHVLARIFKDLITRYKSMRGYYVPRKAGWDTHGLPVELEVERQLGLSGKPQIDAYGIAPFNARCRESVFRYEKEWRKLTERIGFWVDMDHPYVTLDNSYIESVWWIIGQVWERGLLYQDYKVVPYCSRCGTSLSSHEVSLGYEEVEDPSIFVRFRLADDASTSFLVWTTTPWTLPGNVALAIHPGLSYVLVEHDGERLIMAEALVERVLGDTARVLRRMERGELLGRQYVAPFAFVSAQEPMHYVVAGEFVSAEEGTGIVHIAPAFGEDDLAVGKAHGLPVLQPVDSRGQFVAAVSPWAGMFVKEADPLIIENLKQRGLLLRAAAYVHSYPFCWRCKTPLLYYAKTSWFIRTTDVKDDLIRNNAAINWYPEHIKEGRFGNWLETLVDWAFSRERYWGTPLPVWRCPRCDALRCFGSVAELAAAARGGSRPAGVDALLANLDLHRPYVDEVMVPCQRCGGQMRREPEVIDVWFDSGAMPVAQWHYPTENEAVFKENFPADFICEAVDQTRGWFYSLHAIGTLLFNRPTFKNVICLGLVLDENGEKMSKSRGNVVDPWTVFDQHGADALRWYLYTATPPGNARRFSAELVGEVLRRFLMTLWNTYSFFVIYANIDRFDPAAHVLPVERRSLLDRWILSELHGLVATVTEELDAYDVTMAARSIGDFVDELSNWYVRRGRRRYWKSGEDEDKVAAYLTLYESLTTVAGLLAPFTPFVSEEIYRNLVLSVRREAPESVHLTSFPVARTDLIDEALSRSMAVAMRVVGLGRAARNKASLKVRQPLASVVVQVPGATEEEAARQLEGIILDELNVKEMRLGGSEERLLSYSLAPRFNVLGPKYGKLAPRLAGEIRHLDPEKVARQFREGAPLSIFIDGQEYVLSAEEIEVRSQEAAGYTVVEEGGYLVALSTQLSDELVAEGLARELVHRVQTMRKSANFNIEDGIDTRYEGSALLKNVLQQHADYFKQETLSKSLAEGVSPDGYRETTEVAGESITFSLRRVTATANP